MALLSQETATARPTSWEDSATCAFLDTSTSQLQTQTAAKVGTEMLDIHHTPLSIFCYSSVQLQCKWQCYSDVQSHHWRVRV